MRYNCACNLLAEDIEKGELPRDLEWTGKIVQDIWCLDEKLRQQAAIII